MGKYILLFNFIIGFMICSSAMSLTLNYRLEMLGTLGGQSSVAYGINDIGQIVGSSHLSGYSDTRAFLYENGIMINLGTFSSYTSIAYDINNAGQIVGESNVDSTYSHAFLYENGIMIDLGTFGGKYSVARMINESGQIAGQAYIPATIIYGERGYGFLYKNGVMYNLSPLRDGYGLNNNGEVVGYSYNPNFEATYHCGDIDNEEPIIYLGAIDGDWSWAWDINDHGQVVGQSQTSIPGEYHAFLYENGVMKDLGTVSNGTSSYAKAINNSGLIVGDVWVSGRNHAFLYVNGEMIDLNSLIDPDLGWTLAVAYDINEYGDIVGVASSPSQTVNQGFLLYNMDADRSNSDVIPEPASLILLVFALSALIKRK
ncbi:MAG: DUF3466 family protein [Candidatus Auribacterota bacterium]|jgi:probable HAF family extracellular repeat protein|nr:DUF3466 family protein [Candidatus Auribacterota bacterium]